ncbi:MAG: 8-amino-7-oxononanoate synthase [Desulfocapsa sp.]|nr:MAG: 8-amino-7-oxononanoate synthase [Desulfocapsa sp.]
MQTDYTQKLEQLQAKGRLRALRPVESRKYHLNLSSNDYLGIAANQELQQEFYDGRSQSTLSDYKLAASSSRLLTGDTRLAHDLEHKLATAYQSEAALLYNSGYHANIGILPALFGKNDLILSDKLNHASIHDGFRLSRARCKRYNHVDYKQLRSLLEQYRKQYERVVIVSESVFSMDGDVADIEQLTDLKKEFDTMLYIDEAHGVGLYGASGLGKVEAVGKLAEVDLLLGTFGKAWASVGAFVCCSRVIRNYLINHSRSLIFTTGLAPVTLNWNRFVFEKSLTMDEERQHLQFLSQKIRGALLAIGVEQVNSSNIIPILIGDDEKAVLQAAEMQKQGYLILPIRPPAVPEGSARFRLSLAADMQWTELRDLVEQLLKQKSEGL